MEKLKLYQLTSLEKVFFDYEINDEEIKEITGFKNERLSYQIAYSYEDFWGRLDVKVNVDSPLKEYITIRSVGNVPSELPHRDEIDEYYERTTPGLFPDVLYPLDNDSFVVTSRLWHSLWVDINLNGNVESGKYPLDLIFEFGGNSVTKHVDVNIINAFLPSQELIYTQWLHADCIADYYKLETFSEKHWELIDKFIHTASKNGINMILTPVLTPPLDTAIGGERSTIQLVDVVKDGDVYTFNFDKLRRWISILKKNDIKYVEINHLFTQWGAKATPKVIATVDGCEKRIFGWDVSSESYEYESFLSQLLPELYKVLTEEGVQKNTYFHISDEPKEEHQETYLYVKKIAKKYLPDCIFMDALSSYEFYKNGITDLAIPATDHIESFIENNVPELWTYYCGTQGYMVSNRFMAMPSYRNRVIGCQLYKFDIKGFLHWGYNFYNSALSFKKINPFMVTDALNVFPSGDSFSVYPGEDGALESLRIIVFAEALYDLRALKLLESFIGRENVVKIIDEEAGMDVRFSKYPFKKEFVLKLRGRVNREIEKYIK